MSGKKHADFSWAYVIAFDFIDSKGLLFEFNEYMKKRAGGDVDGPNDQSDFEVMP